MKLFHQTTTKIILIALGILILLYISEPGKIMFHIPPHIKNLLWIIFIISGILLLLNYLQPKKPLPPHENINPLAATEITAAVINYGSNGVGDIDKILVQHNNQKMWLHFPPHTAQQILNVAVKNTTISAELHAGKRPANDGIAVYELISLHSDALGKTINVHDIPPPPPDRGNEVEVRGNSIEVKPNEEGRIGAFILSGKLIALPKHTAETMLTLMKQAHQIVVKGYERSASDGFVNSTGLPFIKPYSITIDNINYVIQ